MVPINSVPIPRNRTVDMSWLSAIMMLTMPDIHTCKHIPHQHTAHNPHQHGTHSHPQKGWFSIDLSLPLLAVLCSAPWGWFWKAAGERVIRGGGRQSWDPAGASATPKGRGYAQQQFRVRAPRSGHRTGAICQYRVPRTRCEKCLQKGFIHERSLGLAGLRAERRARPITCGLVDRGLQLLSARRPHRAQPRSNVKLFQAVVPAARESAAWDVA